MKNPTEKKIVDFFSAHQLIELKRGKVIFYPGDTITNIYYIQQGQVKQHAITEAGEEIALHIFREGTYFPIMLSLAGAQNTYTFEALTDVQAWKAPTHDVIAFLKNDPEVLFELATRLSQGIMGLLQKIESILSQDSYKKLCSLLLYFAKHFDKDTSQITIPLTHAEIASWIGSQRETVSRNMEKLKEKNIITYEKNSVNILDKKALENEVTVT